MTPDELALDARFREGFDIASRQVLTLDKPSTSVDRNKPWVRFSTSLGERGRVTNGLAPTHLQLGAVFLEVNVPKSLGASGGDQLIQQFDDLFCDWQSDDGAIEIKNMRRTRTETNELWQHTIRFAFQSKRIK